MARQEVAATDLGRNPAFHREGALAPGGERQDNRHRRRGIAPGAFERRARELQQCHRLPGAGRADNQQRAAHAVECLEDAFVAWDARMRRRLRLEA